MQYIALDIGNVCIQLGHQRLLTELQLQPDFFSRPEIIRAIEMHEFGHWNEDMFFQELHKVPELQKLSPTKLRQGYRNLLCDPVPGMPELLKALPENGIIPVFFSDISIYHLEICRRIIPAMHRYSGVYSFDVHTHKPGPAMFDRFEQLYGQPLLYTDDRSELISAARERGWQAEVFQSCDQLKSLLKVD